MMILVDGTTGQHARGVGVVIDGVLSALPEVDDDAVVATGPSWRGPSALNVRRVRLARTRVGRLAYQRLLLPIDVKSLRAGGNPIDRVLLLDSYMPIVRGNTDVRYAVFIHDVLPLTRPGFWSPMKQLLKRAGFSSLRRARPALFTSTEYNASEVRRLLGLEATVARLGCGQLSDFQADEAMRKPLSEPKPYLLYVGALEPRKNLATLVEAFECMPSSLSRLELTLAGGGSATYIASLRRRVDHSHLRDRIRVLIDPGREVVLPLLTHAATLVFPSKAEGFGLPILEALALGTPVVASDIPEVRSWAEDAILYASPSRPAEWVHAITQAMTSSESSRRRGQTFAQDFRWRACAEHLVVF